MIAQFIFLICLVVATYFLFRNITKIRRNISLGRAYKIEGQVGERIKQMALIAFGQKKMFARPIPAILHLFVYLGFVLINIEILEILIDGVAGTHRVFAKPLGGFYFVVVNFFEFLAVTVALSCAIFLIRRNALKIRRLNMAELTAFPRLDANLILTIEIALMLAFLSMNACDSILQTRGVEHYYPVGSFYFSSAFTPMFGGLSSASLVALERFFWWFHIIGVLAFANYLPYSKHLHIFLAFPNTYYSNLEEKGKMKNMPVVTREVKSMLSITLTEEEQAEAAANTEMSRFGAKDAPDLTWKNLMDAYSCTECGRCTSVCPANLTGKKLSPRKIMMDTRDRVEEIGRQLDLGQDAANDGKSLYGDYISSEELLACTTCNACVDACPINIDPLDIILQLRRYRVMEEAKAPDSWNAMFSNMENNQAPWKFPPSDRFNWAQNQ